MLLRVITGFVLLCMFCYRPTDALAVVKSNVEDNDVEDTNSSSTSVPHKLGVWATKCETSSCVTFCESIGFIFGNCNGNYCICTIPREQNNVIDEPTKLNECNSIHCDQNCQRIGFNGGACVENKCKCDILEPNNLDASVPTNPLTSCMWSSCNSYCQTIGFITGYCLYDNCMCVHPKPTTKHTQDKTHDSDIQNISDAPTKLGVFATKCEYSSCVTYCESIGYIFGNCNGNYCICNYPREESYDLDEPTSNKLDGCNPIQCDQNCRRIGFNGGACVGDKCKCDILQPDNVETSVPTNSLTSCQWSSCNSYCRTIGFITGYCLYDNCMCKYPQPTPKRQPAERKMRRLETVRVSLMFGKCKQIICNRVCSDMGYDEKRCNGEKCECTRSLKGFNKTEGNETSCNVQQCDQLCQRSSFTGGACVRDTCKCNILIEIEGLFDPFRNRNSSCIPRKCEQNCIKTGSTDGHCFNGRCSCNILDEIQSEIDSSAHHLHRREASDCEYNKCDKLCRRVRYDSGVCVGDRCKCDILFPMEGSIIPTDLRGSCTTRTCANFCVSIGFSGSSCVEAKCKCEILLQKEDDDILPPNEDTNVAHLYPYKHLRPQYL